MSNPSDFKETKDDSTINNEAHSAPHNTKTAESVKDSLELVGKFVILLTTSLYVTGFLTVNSHLSKFGYFEYEITSPRFLLAGGLCAVYFLSWYIFSGRSIIYGKRWLAEDIAFIRKFGVGPKWSGILFAKSYVQILFSTCFSATSFGFIAFDSPSPFIFITFMMATFLISYAIDITDTDLSHPRISILVDIAIKLFSIIVFSVSAYIDNRIALLFLSFFGMSTYVNFVLDSFERRGITRDRIVFASIHASIFFLTSITIFGQIFYGDIRPRVGGGQAIPVQLFLSDKITFPGTEEGISVLSADMIYRNSSSVLISLEKSPTVIQLKSVKLIKAQPMNDKSIFEKLDIVFQKLGLPSPEIWKMKI